MKSHTNPAEVVAPSPPPPPAQKAATSKHDCEVRMTFVQHRTSMGKIVPTNLCTRVSWRAVLICEHQNSGLVGRPHALALQQLSDVSKPLVHAVDHASKCAALLVLIAG